MQPTGFLRATLLRRQAGGLGHWRCKSSLAEVTARVLSEGKANSTTGHGAFPGPSLSTLEELTASMPPQPVSILMLTSWARVTKPEGRLLQAKFIRNELIARRAHILTLLHSMPEPLGNQPALASWVNVYWERLRDLLERPEPQTHEEERIFAELCKERNAQIGSIGTAAEETMLVEALQRVQQERGRNGGRRTRRRGMRSIGIWTRSSWRGSGCASSSSFTSRATPRAKALQGYWRRDALRSLSSSPSPSTSNRQ